MEQLGEQGLADCGLLGEKASPVRLDGNGCQTGTCVFNVSSATSFLKTQSASTEAGQETAASYFTYQTYFARWLIWKEGLVQYLGGVLGQHAQKVIHFSSSLKETVRRRKKGPWDVDKLLIFGYFTKSNPTEPSSGSHLEGKSQCDSFHCLSKQWELWIRQLLTKAARLKTSLSVVSDTQHKTITLIVISHLSLPSTKWQHTNDLTLPYTAQEVGTFYLFKGNRSDFSAYKKTRALTANCRRQHGTDRLTRCRSTTATNPKQILGLRSSSTKKKTQNISQTSQKPGDQSIN